MDLAIIQGLLNDFATFGKNIGTALQNFPNLIGSIVDFFTGFEDNADNTSTAFEGLSSSEQATTTNEPKGFSSELSSDDDDKLSSEKAS